MELSQIPQSFSSWFYSEEFWLPPGMSWKDFENRPEDGVYIAQPIDLLYSIPAAIVIFLVRKLFERYIAYPFGLKMKISTKTYACNPNDKLEPFYRKTSYPNHQQVKEIAKLTDLTDRAIERWFRNRRNRDRPSPMVKFTETSWRLLFYLFIFTYGLTVLWDKSWFTNPTMCWLDNFPRQNVTTGMYLYYMIELGFYLGLIFSQFVDVKRKDFWEQFSHHIATIFLMCFSWVCNCVRIGTLVLCLHDAVDWLLEGAKLFRYMNKSLQCDLMFGVFTITWIVTRLFMYPYYILWTTSVEATSIVGPAKSIYLFNALLCVLQVLHIVWFYIIAKVAYKAIIRGEVEKDIRSASESSGDEGSTDVHNSAMQNGKHNGICQG